MAQMSSHIDCRCIRSRRYSCPTGCSRSVGSSAVWPLVCAACQPPTQTAHTHSALLPDTAKGASAAVARRLWRQGGIFRAGMYAMRTGGSRVSEGQVLVQVAINMSLLEYEPVLVSAYTGGAAKTNGAEAPPPADDAADPTAVDDAA